MNRYLTRVLLALTAVTAAVVVTPAAVAAPAAPERCATAAGSGVVRCAATIEQARVDAGVTALVLSARFFDLKNRDFSGAYLELYYPSACTPAYDNENRGFIDLGSSWNNRISSLNTFNQCDAKLFDGAGYSGAESTWIDVYDDLATLGNGWNNRAGSVRLS